MPTTRWVRTVALLVTLSATWRTPRAQTAPAARGQPSAPEAPSGPIVTTTQGQVQGIVTGDVNGFAGILRRPARGRLTLAAAAAASWT